MQFVNARFARILEAAEDIAQVRYAAALAAERPDVGAESRPIGNGHMVFAGVGSPIGRVIGFGLEEEPAAADVDAVESFYAAHGSHAEFDVTPLTSRTLVQILRDRGYAMTEVNNVLARNIDDLPDEFPVPLGIELRPVAPDQAELWAHTVSQGFAEEAHERELPELWRMMVPFVRSEGVIAHLAWHDDRPVGGSACMVQAEHRLMALFGTSSLPGFRGRGIQSALLGLRLQLAVQRGCRLAVVVTNGGSVSQRNAERHGFTVAYSKATLAQRKPGDPE